MEIEIYQVDSFATRAFTGNPAGVCITQEGLDEALMFQIAQEMAVSETAFLSLADMRLRWFSPKVEVKLCGHGTLAVAHIMKELGLLTIGERITFNTLSGPLLVKALAEQIEMDFPAEDLDLSATVSAELLLHLGLKAEQVVACAAFESTKLLIEIANEADLIALQPNFDALKKLSGRAVVITAKATANTLLHGTKKPDFVSRNFAPWVGVNEDPATGSAHCALAVHWGKLLKKTALLGYQASARGAFIEVERLPDQRVKLLGHAVTTIKGTMFL